MSQPLPFRRRTSIDDGHPELPRREGEPLEQYIERLAVHLRLIDGPRTLLRPMPPADRALPVEREPGEDDEPWWKR